ncbi:MAG: folate-binding protein YgfZ [Alphaproteobacteria bacterium]
MGGRWTMLDGRGAVRVDGPDARDFLQRVITQDLGRVGPEQAAWGALLTPQGKFLHEFFLVEHDGALLLDGEAPRCGDLAQRLSRYRLRARVTVAPEPAFAVAAAWGDGAPAALGLPAIRGAARVFAGGVAFNDPRHDGLGARVLAPRAGLATALVAAGLAEADPAGWDAVRLACGVPDGSRDLEIDRSVLLEANFDLLDGIDWSKGCYIGQEVTARTRYRGLLKRRLVGVAIDGPTPPPGTPVTLDGREIGEMRSAAGGRGLALLRLDALAGAAGAPLAAGPARLVADPLPDAAREA